MLALRHDQASTVLMLANVGREDVAIELPDDNFGPLTDLLADSHYDDPVDAPRRLTLKGYGYRWLCPKAHVFG